jgi:hypothetical protein
MPTGTPEIMRGRPKPYLLLAAALLAGCGDNRPVHKDPGDLRGGAVATLVGQNSTYVEEIDGKQVPSAKTVTYSGASYAGGNTVKVAPGRHRLRVYCAAGPERSSGQWEFNFDAEAGHAYELSPASETAVSLQVRDQSTGKVVRVN